MENIHALYILMIDFFEASPCSPHCSFLHPLRVYPLAFAQRILAVFDRLVRHGVGKPVIKSGLSGPLQFQKLCWSDWEEANLMEPLRYARGNKNLRCPAEWKKVFPEEFEILHRQEEMESWGKPREPFLPP